MNKLILSLFMMSVFSISACAVEEVLRISVDDTIQPSEVFSAINDLKNYNFSDELDTCKVNFLRYQIVDSQTPNVSYYGIAYLHINYIDEECKIKFLEFILNDNRFSLVRVSPKGPIPNPSVSGNN